MKYKNIKSAIHNFGYSFVSDENYVNDDYVFFDLAKIHSQGHHITIDWLNQRFEPCHLCTPRIAVSIGQFAAWLPLHLARQQVDIGLLQRLEFVWPADGKHFMIAQDDRCIEHRKVIHYCG